MTFTVLRCDAVHSCRSISRFTRTYCPHHLPWRRKHHVPKQRRKVCTASQFSVFQMSLYPLEYRQYFLTVCCWHGTSCQTAQCFRHLTLFTDLFRVKQCFDGTFCEQPCDSSAHGWAGSDVRRSSVLAAAAINSVQLRLSQLVALFVSWWLIILPASRFCPDPY
jgi:hypothetical protein